MGGKKGWAARMSNLDMFAECVKNAPTVKKAEEHVRMMLERFARNAPAHVIVRLGECIIDIRKSELREEAERN